MDRRRDNFKRLAASRTNEVLRRLKILGNCANRSHYDYTEEEVARIFSEIDKRARQARAKFTFPSETGEEFRI